jgi:hypothetical protein
MHTYKFYWMNGLSSETTGHNVKEAFERASHKKHKLIDLLKYEEI